MSKEDRYAHLGDGIEEEMTDTDETADGTADDPSTDAVHVTIQEGDEETVLTVDPDQASAQDVRAAVEAASSGDSTTARSVRFNDPGRLALELGTFGPRLALKGVESLVEGLQVEHRRD